MKYFVIAVVASLYFEVLGQYILKKLNRMNMPICIGVGFIAFIGVLYLLSSILTGLSCHFSIIFIIYSCVILASVVLIIKDRKNIKYKLTWDHLLLAVLVAIFIYYSMNTSLGHLHGFDTTHYLNMVTSNASWDMLNNKSVIFGSYEQNGPGLLYIFQSFYYFASYIVFLITSITNLFPSTIYIWVFQILYYLIFFSLIINTFHKICEKKYLVLIISILLIGFYFGKLYFNSVYGFYGNSYRFVIFGYVTYFLFDYFKDPSKTNKMLLSMTIFASCACSSSSLFISLIVLYAVFIINNKNVGNY